MINYVVFIFSVKKNNLNDSDSLIKTPIDGKTSAKRKSLTMSKKKVKKIKNV